jgi:hypothetical protein
MTDCIQRVNIGGQTDLAADRLIPHDDAMIRPLALAAIATSVLLATVGCSDPSAPAAPPATTAAPAATTATARAAGVTPDQVCGLVSTAEMSQFTGFMITTTKTATSGNVSVCHYEGTAGDNYVASKVILEYQPDGKGAVEYTKARGEAVSGLGIFAVFFATSGQLDVEVGGDAVFLVFMQDVRANHGDVKGAAVQIASAAVPRLPHA